MIYFNCFPNYVIYCLTDSLYILQIKGLANNVIHTVLLGQECLMCSANS